MLSTEEMDALYSGALTPFTNDEWVMLSEHYKLKNPLENSYAHILDWSHLLKDWMRFLSGQTNLQPSKPIWEYLFPGKYDPNPLAKTLRDALVEAAKYGYGSVPRIAIIPYFTKGLLRFIAELDQVYHSASLDDVKHATKEYCKHLLHQGPREMPNEEFERVLTKSFEVIIAAFQRYSKELGVYINQQLREGRNTQPLPTPAPIVEKGFADVSSSHAAIEKAVVKGAAKITKAVKKPRGKRGKYTSELQDAVYTIHLKAKNNAEVKSSSKTSSSHDAEFDYSRKKLAEIGVDSVDIYERILTARTNRLYNAKRNRRSSS